MRLKKEQIAKSSIFIAVLILYVIFLSPLVENKLEESILNYTYAQTEPIKNSSSNLNESILTNQYLASNLQNTKAENYYKSNSEFSLSDPRVIAMREYLKDYNSPMYYYADVFVYEADKYGLDWRLVASISGVESAFGNITPTNSNNAWGWKGGPNGSWSKWPSWKEGIETVTRGLALGYGTDLTPRQIEGTYCPPCSASHAWSIGVQGYMNELEYYENNLENL